MFKRFLLLTSTLCFMAAVTSVRVNADNDKTDINTFELEPVNMVTRTSYMVKTLNDDTAVRQEPDSFSSEIAKIQKDSVYELLENIDDTWAKIVFDGQEGYVNIEEDAVVYENIQRDADEESELRKNVVENALSFVGGDYVWGGEDPFSGVDCSGFTAYIMEDTAGVNLTHYSGAQASEGKVIGRDELQPGDLVFYSGENGINHVAIYAGHDKIVHASSSTTGIILSDMENGRTPVRFVSVLDDLQTKE